MNSPLLDGLLAVSNWQLLLLEHQQHLSDSSVDVLISAVFVACLDIIAICCCLDVRSVGIMYICGIVVDEKSWTGADCRPLEPCLDGNITGITYYKR